MKYVREFVWVRRALAAVALAAGVAVAAVVLHPPPPPPPEMRLTGDVAPAAFSPGHHEDAPGRQRRPAHPVPGPPVAAAVTVYVAGAVIRPGVYTLGPSARVVDALARAGGAGADADLLRVNLAAHLSDGEEIAVLRHGEAAPSARRTASPRRATHRKKRRAVDAVGVEPLDLNSASADDLAELPGLGAELAERIVEFREVNGPFASVDELADVSGMTPARLDRLADRVTVR